ncbi:hypothetical protein CONCODRAFT_154600 [Conidiobolus coronatus NRRL 28638]|uniref:Uncharacterized protein n=1 Tax=Conidiobolus coronatus (strain ATCC 28846 / CBS 209.66 / NRRL 28638) TaxID=796925 RepID=A0A137PH92_CONC2|nr:hypothetical protein CONCODRAFT_154600 [Conidiobolus coronatus NRRL 28638]|eukprot:KXN74374.1 hypothetical protein CONCODRAFT_154600 [Conidiobolus coronatus NRRL 28638]
MNLYRYKQTPHFGRITPQALTRWAPTLALFGATAGVAVLFLGEGIPLVQQDILSRIPLAGRLWAKPDEE